MIPPPEGWLARWQQETSRTMMAPEAFRLGSGLATLSATIGRLASWPLWGRTWHPHLWIVLVGAAGHNKSTPTFAGEQLVRIVRGDDAIGPSMFSVEGFVRRLETCPDLLWDAGELKAFLENANRDHMRQARAWFCDVWDSKTVQKDLSKKADSITVEDPAITALVTARLTDFEEAAGLADFASGFFSRFLLFHVEEAPDPNAYIGLTSQARTTVSTSLARELADIRRKVTTHPDITFTPEAARIWEAYDRPWQYEDAPDELSGWARRRGIQALKVAVLHHASRGWTGTVGPEDVAYGIAIVKDHWRSARLISLDRLGHDPRTRLFMRATQRLLEALREAGGEMTQRDVMRRLKADADTMGRWRETWEGNGDVLVKRQQRSGPVTWIYSLPEAEG